MNAIDEYLLNFVMMVGYIFFSFVFLVIDGITYGSIRERNKEKKQIAQNGIDRKNEENTGRESRKKAKLETEAGLKKAKATLAALRAEREKLRQSDV